MQLLPPRVQQFSRYPQRNSEDFAIPVTRIATYYNSFLPTALRDWNTRYSERSRPQQLQTHIKKHPKSCS